MVVMVAFTSITVSSFFESPTHTKSKYHIQSQSSQRTRCKTNVNRHRSLWCRAADSEWAGSHGRQENDNATNPPIILQKISLSTHGYMADWWLLHTRTEVLRSTTANLLWQFLSSLAIRRASRQVYTKYVRSKRRGRPGGLFLSQSIPKHCFQLSVY